jgi:hypothetical protein
MCDAAIAKVRVHKHPLYLCNFGPQVAEPPTPDGRVLREREDKTTFGRFKVRIRKWGRSSFSVALPQFVEVHSLKIAPLGMIQENDA